MEEKDSMELAFYFNQQMYDLLDDEAKFGMLLSIQQIISDEMGKLMKVDAPPKMDDKILPN